MSKKKEPSVSERVFALAQELLERELTWYKNNPVEGGRVPSALLSAGLASGKATGIAEKVAEDQRREAIADTPIVYRVPPDSFESFCEMQSISVDDLDNAIKLAKHALTLIEAEDDREPFEAVIAEAQRRQQAQAAGE